MHERKKCICWILYSYVNIIILSHVIQNLNFLNTLKVMNLNIKIIVKLNIVLYNTMITVFNLTFILKINLKLLYKY